MWGGEREGREGGREGRVKVRKLAVVKKAKNINCQILDFNPVQNKFLARSIVLSCPFLLTSSFFPSSLCAAFPFFFFFFFFFFVSVSILMLMERMSAATASLDCSVLVASAAPINSAACAERKHRSWGLARVQ